MEARDVGHAQVQEQAQIVLVFRRRRDHVRLIVGRSAADVDREPQIPQAKKCRFSYA
jgi:hypothetical protein